ncbi:gas vesicle protein GvpO [Desulfosporosinus sp. SYSU MS00001]|uniref:gas vesicle protein GvpO n=1 Tax=Desulfosporosinus sp. SYSU MS00001 TaxID=3416284 RepID=UPI003CFA60FB
MALEQIISLVKQFSATALETKGRVISIEKKEDGWLAILETVEESDYMRQRALNDIIGLYELKINEHLEIVSYKRIGLRERTSLGRDEEDNDI